MNVRTTLEANIWRWTAETHPTVPFHAPFGGFRCLTNRKRLQGCSNPNDNTGSDLSSWCFADAAPRETIRKRAQQTGWSRALQLQSGGLAARMADENARADARGRVVGRARADGERKTRSRWRVQMIPCPLPLPASLAAPPPAADPRVQFERTAAYTKMISALEFRQQAQQHSQVCCLICA